MPLKTKSKLENQFKIQDYMELIEKTVKVEFKHLCFNHIIDFSELIQIGIQVVYELNGEQSIENHKKSYISTAIKWAIRNEVRRRIRWYSAKIESHKNSQEPEEDNENINNIEIREEVYKSILSIEEMASAPKPILIQDGSKNPEEIALYKELNKYIKEAIEKLPLREKELIESRFFKDKKLKDLAIEFDISQSRISRIIQSGLNKLKKELATKNIFY